MTTAVRRVADAFARIEQVDRPEVWIDLRDRDAAMADAAAVDARTAAGENLPLAGVVVAVKGNIDVAGLPTTAACPAYAYQPARSAPVVQRLVDAGAVVLGTTNLDQFATGLVGVRSPHGAVRDAARPDHVSGGSSSGSAVAVALGIVDLALGTDTAGSGRVPAAFQGIVGLKPSRGLLPTSGVVPACRELDCVSVFARTVSLARLAAAVMAGVDDDDPLSRPWAGDAPLAAPPRPRIGVPAPADLPELSAQGHAALQAAAETLVAAGAELVPVPVQPFLDAGALLYGGGFIAQRYAAVGAFIEQGIAAQTPGLDPTVATLVLSAKDVAAHTLVADTEVLDRLRHIVSRLFSGVDAVLLPTVPHQPTIAAVQADPIGANARLGIWTTSANLLDLAVVAVPAGEVDGGHFGVSLLAPAFHDAVVADLAQLLSEPATDVAAQPFWGPPGIGLVVVGAHLSGLQLNGQLTASGARLVSTVRTAPTYRLYALDTQPPKPGLVHVPEAGASVEGELWQLSPVALADLLSSLPQPMALGPVQLDDGSTHVGFLCQPAAVDGAADISDFGGWRGYLAATGKARS